MIIKMGIEHVCFSQANCREKPEDFHVIFDPPGRWLLTWDIEGAQHPLDTDTETLERVSAPMIEIPIEFCPWCGGRLKYLSDRIFHKGVSQ